MGRSQALKEYWKHVKLYAKREGVDIQTARRHMVKIRNFQIGIYRDGKLIGVKTVRYRERRSHKKILNKWEKWAKEKSEESGRDYKVKFKKLPCLWMWSKKPVR